MRLRRHPVVTTASVLTAAYSVVAAMYLKMDPQADSMENSPQGPSAIVRVDSHGQKSNDFGHTESTKLQALRSEWQQKLKAEQLKAAHLQKTAHHLRDQLDKLAQERDALGKKLASYELSQTDNRALSSESILIIYKPKYARFAVALKQRLELHVERISTKPCTHCTDTFQNKILYRDSALEAALELQNLAIDFGDYQIEASKLRMDDAGLRIYIY